MIIAKIIRIDKALIMKMLQISHSDDEIWQCVQLNMNPQFDPEALHMCTKLSGVAAQYTR